MYVSFILMSATSTSDPDDTRVQPGRAAARLDRDAPLPLWAQLEADLRRRLAADDFTERFPTDRELVEAYGVGRQTAREAVRRLRADGLLDRRQGRGTFVRRSEFEQPLGALYSLFRSVEAQGIAQTSAVTALEEHTHPAAAARLGLDPAEPLLYLERIRYAGGEPLALDRVWLPADLTRPLLHADFTRTALYDELARRCGLVLTGGEERIGPVVPTAEERAALELPDGVALFEIERAGRTGDRVVEWRHSLVRGDRYRFVADWTTAGRSDATRSRHTFTPARTPVRGSPGIVGE